MIDFKVKDTGKEYWMYPLSKIAKEICKHYKGVYMECFLLTHSEYDNFLDSYSRLTNIPLTTEEEMQ